MYSEGAKWNKDLYGNQIDASTLDSRSEMRMLQEPNLAEKPSTLPIKWS